MYGTADTAAAAAAKERAQHLVHCLQHGAAHEKSCTDATVRGLFVWLEERRSDGCTEADTALAFPNAMSVASSVWVRSTKPPLWLPRDALSTEQQRFTDVVAGALLRELRHEWTLAPRRDRAAVDVAPFVLLAGYTALASAVLKRDNDLGRVVALLWSHATGTRAAQPAVAMSASTTQLCDDVSTALNIAQDNAAAAAANAAPHVAQGPTEQKRADAAAELAREYGRDIALVVLYALLPHCHAADPTYTSISCVAALLSGGARDRHVYMAVRATIPSVLTLQPELATVKATYWDWLYAAARIALWMIGGRRDDAVARIHGRHAHHTLHDAHPCLAASVLYSASHVQQQLHVCRAVRCKWWRAMCDHFVQLHQASWMGAPRGARDALRRALYGGGRFRDFVKLLAYGAIEIGELRDAVGHAEPTADFTRSDIADALAGALQGVPDNELATPCDEDDNELARKHTAAMLKSYIRAVCWLTFDLRTSCPLNTLPQWTPETHCALYRFCGQLHKAVFLLSLVYERPGTLLAVLPRELLFHVFDYVMLALCARGQRQ